ncbi:uncharacterized protein LOC105838482 [Monomorium pharaonis]|uniref:uncharacterized protein LOC105838482 n=1 Tax=Monomorium pharaonis TaxID=307658 RepID=UPI001745DCC7|nr:uncharacterized protein LOC105838482 [Monomorium pharaonis]XP_012539517.2 uncharacterized protein LOC105838482 [Monomorium pharaonis]
MTVRGSRRAAAKTSLCLLAVLLVLSCAASGSGRAHALPQPEPLPPGLLYGDSAEEAENIMLINRLKQLSELKHRLVEQEHEINNEQLAIQEILETKARAQESAMSVEQLPPDYPVGESQPEPLPKPEPFIHDPQHSRKREGMNTVSYMSLCHFKICNMGRKRQSK